MFNESFFFAFYLFETFIVVNSLHNQITSMEIRENQVYYLSITSDVLLVGIRKVEDGVVHFSRITNQGNLAELVELMSTGCFLAQYELDINSYIIKNNEN